MSFWGIQLKPGKPYTHLYDNDRGILRISQASLGSVKSDEKSDEKSIVRCNIGDNRPIVLCNLIPNVFESCHLELEFAEEEEEVVFSVLGKRSVYLSGYFVGGCRHEDLDGYDFDSCGEESESSESYESLEDSESEYDSEFIDDDDDVDMFSSPPQRKSGVVIEEIVEDDKPSTGNGRRSKKKDLVNDSDGGVGGSQGQLVVKSNMSNVLESEDEDGFPISVSSRKKNAPQSSEGNANLKSDKTVDKDMQKEMNTLSEDDRSIRETTKPSESGEAKKSRKNNKAKDETNSNISTVERLSVEPDHDKDDKEVAKDNVMGLDGSENAGKAKKKKKTKKRKTTEAGDISVGRTQDKSVEITNEAFNDDKMDHDLSVDNKSEKMPNSEMTNTSGPATATKETDGKLKKKIKKKRAKDDRDSDAEGGEVAGFDQISAKKKKKESKNNGITSAPTEESGEHGKAGLKTRTYANGLVVENLAMGKPDGQRATPGKKVFVNYIGKLKDGKIFDSNVGKRPFEFRLGIGRVIKGWDVGVNGMRVGDKRRITIPPSYGYGQKKVGPIPANSWLTFDVELVKVN